MLKLLSSADYLKKNFFNSLRNAIRKSNSLDPDQGRHSLHPDQGPTCLQMLSQDLTKECVTEK